MSKPSPIIFKRLEEIPDIQVSMASMLWNLTGGIFVLRGGYHAPTATEQKEMEGDT